MKVDPSFSTLIKEIRELSLKDRMHTRKVIHWTENSRLRSGPGKAIVFILPTRGCSWALSKSGGCSICGYIYDNPTEPDFELILSSIDEILSKSITNDEKYSIKLFTSGSFLDTSEIPIEIQTKILKKISRYKEVAEIVLESRPEYVTDKTLKKIAEVIDIKKIEIAIGLESANNNILKKSINKGFWWDDFVEANSKIVSAGAKVKAYLLFKPPFVSEFDSIRDIFESVAKLVTLGIDTISINSVSIHRGTFLSKIFDNQQYRPPWLWSLLHLCKEIKSKNPEFFKNKSSASRNIATDIRRTKLLFVITSKKQNKRLLYG